MKDNKFPDFVFKNADKIEYRIVWQKPAKSFNASGLCDSPDSKFPEIWIDPSLDKKRFIEVVIEEVFHAHCFDKNEKIARKFASNLRKILLKII